MSLAGGCQCGAVRYRIESVRVAYCCHCTQCQKQSGSAFAISVRVARSDFEVAGPLASWSRSTDSGSTTDCHFCTRCGTRIYHSGHSRPGFVTVKGGTLDDPQAVRIEAHIWTRSRRLDLALDPALPSWEGQPDGEEAWNRLTGSDG